MRQNTTKQILNIYIQTATDPDLSPKAMQKSASRAVEKLSEPFPDASRDVITQDLTLYHDIRKAHLDLKQAMKADKVTPLLTQSVADVLYKSASAKIDTDLTETVDMGMYAWSFQDANLWQYNPDLAPVQYTQDGHMKQLAYINDNYYAPSTKDYPLKSRAFITLDDDKGVVPVDADTLMFMLNEFLPYDFSEDLI